MKRGPARSVYVVSCASRTCTPSPRPPTPWVCRVRWSVPTSPTSRSTCAASFSTAPRAGWASPPTAPSTWSAAAASSPSSRRPTRRCGARASRPEGRLRVDVPVVFGRALLIPALPKFQARYPQLQLEVQFNDRVIDLIAEEVDLVVRVGAVREPHLIARRVRDHAPRHLRRPLSTCASTACPRSRRTCADHKLIGHLGAERPPPAQVAVPARRRAAPADAAGQRGFQLRRGAGAGRDTRRRRHAVDGPGGGRGADQRQARRRCCRSGRRPGRRSRWCAAPRCATRPRYACSPISPSELLLQYRQRVDALLES